MRMMELSILLMQMSAISSETSANHQCRHCNAIHWEPFNPSDRRVEYNKWVKITDFGWVYRDFIDKYIYEEETTIKPSMVLLEELGEIKEKFNCYIPTDAA